MVRVERACDVCVRHLSTTRSTIRFRRCNWSIFDVARFSTLHDSLVRRALLSMPRVVFVFWALLLTSVGAVLWHQDHVTLDVRQGPQAHKRPARHNTTMKWLLHARPGVCAPTEITQGNCHTGAKGAWALRREQSTGWHTTVNHCLRLCSSCPRCGYISVHAAEPAECNWFAECRLEKLKGNPKAADGWRSGHAGAAASSIASSAAFVASIENQAARDAPVHCDDRPHAGFRGLLYNASACSLTYPPRNIYPFRLRQLHKCGAVTGWSRELLETMPLPLPEEQPSLIRRRPAACLCASCQNCQYR